MKVVVIGCGRMGTLLRTTSEAHGHEVIGNFDIFNKDELTQAADVVIDFSHRDNISWVVDYCKENGAALVMGTTGLQEEHMNALKELSQTNPVFFSANYSYGVAVLRKALEMLTPMLEEDYDMEMVEKHHNQKADAPSGTALMLLNAMDPDNKYNHVFGREGMIGKRGHEIGISALRGGTVAGEHTIYYFGQDETITISHNATSRQIFVNGAVKAAEYLVKQQPGYYSMDDLLAE